MTLYSLREFATGWAHLELHLELDGVRPNPTNGREISRTESTRAVRILYEISYSAYNL